MRWSEGDIAAKKPEKKNTDSVDEKEQLQRFKCIEADIESMRFKSTKFMNDFLFSFFAVLIRSIALVNSSNFDMSFDIMIVVFVVKMLMKT